MHFSELISLLQNPDIYPEHPERVEVIQTHISAIFVAGEHVYKIKKPVDFGFLNFTSLEKRKYYCEQEVILNRRLCPKIYLGVIEIRFKDGQVCLGGDQGEIIEYAVVMKKLPAEYMMDRMLAQGLVSLPLIQRLASKIALFHKQARTDKNIAAFGSLETILQNVEENFIQTEKYIGQCLTRNIFQEIKENTYSFLENKKSLFAQRVAAGLIRDGHGDLHLKHICLSDDILIFDCIEFNDRFRYGDVAADIAFLLMDLDFHGFPLFSAELAAHYLSNTKDWPLYLLLNFYKTYRAYVRGKVISFRLEEKEISVHEKEEVLKEAQKYFALAHYYAQKLNTPALFLVGGLIGTGKSTIARHLSHLLNWQVLSSDIVRKELAHLPPASRRWEDFQQGIYSPEFSQRTYQALWERAAQILRTGNSVIIDASFSKKNYRQKGLELARESGADFFFIECTCAEEEIRKRLERRRRDVQEPSDGRWEIFADLQKNFEEIREFDAETHLILDTSRSWEETIEAIFHFLLLREGKRLQNATWKP